MLKEEKGYIVVETIGSFVPFILIMVSILTLVNVVTVQARVHNAITQAANTLSVYSYTLEVTGVASNLVTINKKSSDFRETTLEDINIVINGLNSLAGKNVTYGTNSWGDKSIDNPEAFIQGLANYGIDHVSKLAFEELLKSLVNRYLSTNDLSGDEYLKKANVLGGIDGLKFNGLVGGDSNIESVLIDKNGDVKISVSYDIQYKFGAIPLPFDRLSITQSVKTKAWLSGSGEGYRKSD